jgi:hypothetical protein
VITFAKICICALRKYRSSQFAAEGRTRLRSALSSSCLGHNQLATSVSYFPLPFRWVCLRLYSPSQFWCLSLYRLEFGKRNSKTLRMIGPGNIVRDLPLQVHCGQRPRKIWNNRVSYQESAFTVAAKVIFPFFVRWKGFSRS